MTYWGTNTYLLGRQHIAVIDPGPADPGHLNRICAAVPAGGAIRHILVTHAHKDHSAGAAALAQRVGAPVLAFGDAGTGRSPRMAALAEAGGLEGGEGVDADFRPDRTLMDDAVLETPDWRLRALWTPGHMGNHLCFAEAATGTVFTGDLVMGWATSLVSPPDGDLGAFWASLARLAARKADRLYLPGHGEAVADPLARVAALDAHRRMRHAQIRAALQAAPDTAPGLAARLYDDVDPRLLPAAARNVLAHLLEMVAQNEAAPEGPLRADAVFRAL